MQCLKALISSFMPVPGVLGPHKLSVAYAASIINCFPPRTSASFPSFSTSPVSGHKLGSLSPADQPESGCSRGEFLCLGTTGSLPGSTHPLEGLALFSCVARGILCLVVLGLALGLWTLGLVLELTTGGGGEQGWEGRENLPNSSLIFAEATPFPSFIPS